MKDVRPAGKRISMGQPRAILAPDWHEYHFGVPYRPSAPSPSSNILKHAESTLIMPPVIASILTFVMKPQQKWSVYLVTNIGTEGEFFIFHGPCHHYFIRRCTLDLFHCACSPPLPFNILKLKPLLVHATMEYYICNSYLYMYILIHKIIYFCGRFRIMKVVILIFVWLFSYNKLSNHLITCMPTSILYPIFSVPRIHVYKYRNRIEFLFLRWVSIIVYPVVSYRGIINIRICILMHIFYILSI